MGSALGAARDSSDKVSLATISSHCPSAALRFLAASESFATNLKVAPTESKVLWSGGLGTTRNMHGADLEAA
jgi:hypothetical protein